MAKRFAWALFLALTVLACHDDGTVAGPDVVYSGVAGVWTAEWSLCGRHSVSPAPDYSNPELGVAVSQDRSHFSGHIPGVGTITGELAPHQQGILRYTWVLRLDPPCSGTVSGSDTSTDGLRFTLTRTDAWRCAPC